MIDRRTLDSVLKTGLLIGLVACIAAPAAAQPPDPWTHLSAELDTDQDGVVTRDEFDQGASRFPRLDRNGDGVLTEEDFAGGPAFGGESARAGATSPADADGDGMVSGDEWQAYFNELDADGDGALSRSELPRPRRARHGHGPGPGKGRGPDRGAFAGMVISRAADGDGDGEVAAEEWQGFVDALAPDPGGVIAVENLVAALPGPSRGRRGGGDPGERVSRLFDQDGDGFLEVEDLNAVFNELDQDGDGALGADEAPDFRHGRRGGPTGR